MKCYYVIYDEIEGRFEDQTHNVRVIGCKTAETAKEHIINHPEAKVIYGEMCKVEIVPVHAIITIPPEVKEKIE
jgi:hypothetical protein